MRSSRPALKALVLAPVLALTLGLSACSGDSGSDSGGGGGDGKGTQKVRFGYIGDYNGASLLAIADERGLWKKQGLSADYKTFTNGPIQIQALGTRDLDFGYIGPGAVWLPATGKADVVAVDTLTYADRVIARPGIDSVKDLKGKKVGVPEGTSGEMVLNLALQKAGLSEKDIQKVPLDATTVVSAFVAGKIDAAGFWYPAIDTIKAKKPDTRELASTEQFTDRAFPTAFVAGTSVKPALREKVVKVLQEANDYRFAHPKESIASAAKLLKVDVSQVEKDASHVKTLSTKDLVAKTEDGTVAGWFKGLEDFFVSTGQLPAAKDPDEFYDGDLYTKAHTR